MKTYSVNEASEILGIKPRAVQHRCKRDNIRKKSNKYLITDEIIALWKELEAEANAKINAKVKRIAFGVAFCIAFDGSFVLLLRVLKTS